MLRAGIRAKEVFAMIVDAIMNLLPPLIVQILCAIMRVPFAIIVGQVKDVKFLCSFHCMYGVLVYLW
jgi:hypothetical protein